MNYQQELNEIEKYYKTARTSNRVLRYVTGLGGLLALLISMSMEPTIDNEMASGLWLVLGLAGIFGWMGTFLMSHIILRQAQLRKYLLDKKYIRLNQVREYS